MKREMLKSYEAPLTRRTQVALESGICAGSADVENPIGQYGEISAQDVNDGFTTDFSTSSDNVWK